LDHMPRYTKARLLSQKPHQHVIGCSGNLTSTLKDIEERIIREQLEANRWNVSKTARDLGIVRQSLLYRMQKLNIDNPYSRGSSGD
ncbi:MAG: helix-turn-helix domain-containing protein, partial [Clostridia bacterium]|nr:helix-turn-helix domain-containing protein [Clostridia bacterium]